MNTEDPRETHTISLLREMYGSHTVLIPKSRPHPDDYARSLLGQQVRVVLGYDPPDGSDKGQPVIAEGRLLGFGQGGDVEILDDDGFVHYCWPMLKVEPR